MTIGKHIVTVLESVQGLSGKVYALIAPQGAKFPYVVYRRTGTSVEYTNDGSATDTTAVTLLVIGKDYATAASLAEDVRKALECVPRTYDGFNVADCEVTNVSDEYVEDQDCYAVQIGLSFVHF